LEKLRTFSEHDSTSIDRVAPGASPGVARCAMKAPDSLYGGLTTEVSRTKGLRLRENP
jgi:hypothetical protein